MTLNVTADRCQFCTFFCCLLLSGKFESTLSLTQLKKKNVLLKFEKGNIIIVKFPIKNSKFKWKHKKKCPYLVGIRLKVQIPGGHLGCVQQLISKGQLSSEWIHMVIISPKMPTKSFQDFCPGSFLEGRAEILFWLAFWEKRWPDKFILNLTDL